MNALMLLVALRFAGASIRPLRVACGASFGAGAAWAVRLCGAGRAVCLWLPIAAGMMILSAGRRACRRPVYHALCLLSAGGLLGGVVLALAGAVGSLAFAYLLGGLCAVWIALSVLRMRRADPHRDVYIEYGGARMRAIIDTGNTLRDYLTGCPVIVVPEASDQARQMTENLPLRPIFADTAGGRQMMRLCVPESVMLHINGKRKTALAAVALAPALDARAPALVPQALLDEKEDSISCEGR